MHSEKNERLLLSIVDTVSDALDTPMEQLPTLNESVDLGALVTEDRSSSVAVSFDYSGLCVLVRSRELIYAQPRDDDASERLEDVRH